MADINFDSVAFAGPGSVDAKTAADLLDDWLPQNLGAVYRPSRVPRKLATLNAVINWLESDDVLGENGTVGSDDLVASLVERQEAGDAATLVVLWPEEPGEEDLKLVKRAFDAGIAVKNLGGNGALDDLDMDEVFPPEPEAEPEAEAEEAGEVAETVAEAVTAVVGTGIAGALEQAIRAVVRDEIERLGHLPVSSTAREYVATADDTAKVARKLNGDDEPPFDGPTKPASTVFKKAPGGAGDDRIKYYVNEDGQYRKGNTRPRKDESVAMLSLEEIDDLVRRGLIADDKPGAARGRGRK